MTGSSLQKNISLYHTKFSQLREEYSKIVVGQESVLDKLMIALICRGNVLIEGLPGIAKTLIVKTLAAMSGCQFSRIQFTPDLLPGDITGVVTYDEIKKFHIIKGPIFSNFILADEINRASPKVQSALLEAMQERQATIGNATYPLPKPFIVVATQNPIESLGVYNLPEAQIDRFLFKLLMSYPSKQEEERILEKNVTIRDFEHFLIQPIIEENIILQMQQDVHEIFLKDSLKTYIISIIDATRKPSDYKLSCAKYIELGVSPRASIGMYIAAKAHALISNKTFVTPHNIKHVAYDILRHRILLNYEAQSDGVTQDNIIDEILKKIPLP